MPWTWLLPVAMLLSVDASASAGPDPDLKQLTNELLAASGAEPVDCGSDKGLGVFDYIGCGQVTGPLKDFEKRAHAALTKSGWKPADEWHNAALTCPPPSPNGPYPFSAEKTPYTLFLSLRCSSAVPNQVLLGWVRIPPLADPNYPDDVSPPERVTFIEPEYPKKARKERIEGKVVLELVVNRKGDVEDVRIIESSPTFDKAAIDAARQWKYRPAMLKGNPVKVFLTAVIEFNLD